MSQTIFIPPFQDLDSLLDKSTYDILTLNGSLPYYLFDVCNFIAYVNIKIMLLRIKKLRK